MSVLQAHLCPDIDICRLIAACFRLPTRLLPAITQQGCIFASSSVAIAKIPKLDIRKSTVYKWLLCELSGCKCTNFSAKELQYCLQGHRRAVIRASIPKHGNDLATYLK